MTHMLTILAAAPPAHPDTLISGAWLIEVLKVLVPALFAGGLTWIVAFRKGRARATQSKITVQDPVPEVPVKRVYSPPTFAQHMDLVRRIVAVEEDLAQVRRDQAQQYIKLMEVGEARKDAILDRFNTVAEGFHSRVNQLVAEKRKEGA